MRQEGGPVVAAVVVFAAMTVASDEPMVVVTRPW
jgi:hypothetical protein